MRSQIRRELIRRIADGTYQPGDRLVELHIAKEFSTSQAPVREALRELEAMRLVETEPFKGTRVRDISDREQWEAAAVRGMLEESAAQQAEGIRCDIDALRAEVRGLTEAAARGDLDGFARHNTAFHRRIVQAADNQVMLRIWDSLLIEARTRFNLINHRFELDAVAATHEPIVAALAAGDRVLAGRLLREHAEGFARGLGATTAGPAGPAAPPA